MALLKPVLFSIPAFDANTENAITFSVPVGGDQVTKNRLTIINQSTGVQVYQATQTTFTFTHTLPANTLVNGGYYSAYINTFNASGDMSINSNTIQFYCYTTPSLAFTNLPTDNIIANNTFNFQMTYGQVEGELLDSYKYDLYDAQQILIATSGVKYVGSSTPPPTVLSYEFGGLLDNTSYYIRGVGLTVNGTSIQTPLTQITIKYVRPNVFAIVELSQSCSGGYVTAKSNMINTEGESNPTPPIYIDTDTAVDLRADGYYVEWAKNQFSIDGDFTLSVWGRDFNIDKNIITLQNASGDTITIRYCQGYEQNDTVLKTYVDCTVKQGISIYYIYSNYITNPLDTEKVQIWLRRINNLYSLELHNLQ